MDKKIRFGLVGVGAEGGSYADWFVGRSGWPGVEVPECPPHCTLGGLCDIDPAVEERCKKDYPDYPFFRDWKELVDSGTCDAIITTVPHYLHHEVAIYCLEHGVPVLVEKPAGVRAKDVMAMNKCASEHPDVAFGIMFNQRTNVIYQKIREIVASGELGEMRRSNWIINSWWRTDGYYRQSDWRATWGGEGGGVLVNQAPHQLDLWQWICGTPKKVYAKCICGAHRDIVVENDVTILTEYENGATGAFITCTHDPIGTDRLEIDFDGGKIVVEDSERVKIYRLAKKESDMNANMTMDEIMRLSTSNAASVGFYQVEEFNHTDKWGYQHLAVMENFAKHILTGEPLLAPGSDGIMGVNLANAAQLSGWLDQPVPYPVDPELYAKELNKKIAAEGKFPVRE